MAYKTADLKKKAIKVIKEKSLIFIEEIISYLPCAKPTFYDHFPNESNDYKELFALLEKNRDEIKSKLRIKWYNTDNATLQMALMRLVCTDTERRKLAINYTELTGKDGSSLIPEYPALSETEKIQLHKLLSKSKLNGQATRS